MNTAQQLQLLTGPRPAWAMEGVCPLDLWSDPQQRMEVLAAMGAAARRTAAQGEHGALQLNRHAEASYSSVQAVRVCPAGHHHPAPASEATHVIVTLTWRVLGAVN